MKRWITIAVIALFYVSQLYAADTLYKGSIGSTDINWGDGTFKRRTSTGGELNMNKVNSSHIPLKSAPGYYVDDLFKAGSPLNIYPAYINSELYLARPYVDARVFGAVGDGVTDDTAALQAAIDNITAGGIGDPDTLLIPPGRYKTTTTLHVYNSATGVDTYCSIRIIGGTFPNFDGQHSTIIEPDFADKPVIAITRATGVEISGLNFVGKNNFEDSEEMDLLATYLDNSNFVKNSSRDTRYSPYCAIAVDPFQSSVPPDGGYPGLTSWYSTSNYGSTKIRINNCTIWKFVVGIAISPAQSTQNAEDIHIDQVHFRCVKYGVSSGQSQTRSNWMTRCTLQNFWIGIVGTIHGNQIGNIPHVSNLLATQGLYVASANVAWGPASFDKVYTEMVYGPGVFSNGTAAGYSARWTDSHFTIWFDDYEDGVNNEPYYHVHTSAMDSFNNCTFLVANRHTFRVYASGSVVTFNNCTFSHYGGDPTNNLPVYVEPIHNVTYNNCKMEWYATSYYIFDKIRNANDWSTFTRQYAFPGTRLMSVSVSGTADYFKTVGMKLPNKYLGTPSVTVNGDGTATFTYADADKVIRADDFILVGDQYYVEDDAQYHGNLSYYSQPLLGTVKTVTDNTVTVWQVPPFVTSDSLYLWLVWYPRMHLASTGDTHSNTTIDNVTSVSTWQAGDRISGTGIPDGAWVTNVTDNTLTISISATSTGTGVRLYDADVYKFTGTAE